MNRRISAQHATRTTALSLAGFDLAHERPLSTTRELAGKCRALDISCAGDGINYADDQIAGHCAEALERLAARFRGAQRQLVRAA